MLFSVFRVPPVKTKCITRSLFAKNIFIPAIINYNYFDFFSDKALDFMRSSKPLSFFLESPYPMGFQKLIGTEIVGRHNNLNVGFLGAGYVHGGILGTIIFAIVVGLIIGLFDSVINRSANKNVAISICSVSFFLLFSVVIS